MPKVLITPSGEFRTISNRSSIHSVERSLSSTGSTLQLQSSKPIESESHHSNSPIPEPRISKSRNSDSTKSESRKSESRKSEYKNPESRNSELRLSEPDLIYNQSQSSHSSLKSSLRSSVSSKSKMENPVNNDGMELQGQLQGQESPSNQYKGAGAPPNARTQRILSSMLGPRLSAIPAIEESYSAPKSIEGLRSQRSSTIKRQYQQFAVSTEISEVGDCPQGDTLPEVLEAIARMRNQDVCKLTHAIGKHRQELKNRDRELHSLKDKLENAQKREKALVDKYEAKLGDMIDRERVSRASTQHLQDVEIGLRRMSNELADKKRTNQMLTRALEESRKTEARTREALLQSEQKQDQLEREYARTEAEGQQVKTDNIQLKEDLESMHEAAEELRTELDELRNFVPDVEDKNEKLVNEWKRVNDLAGKYRAALMEAEAENQNLSGLLKDQEAAAKEQEVEARKSIQVIEMQRQQEAQEVVAIEKKKNEELRRQSGSIQAELNQCRRVCNELRKELDAQNARTQKHSETLHRDLGIIRNHLEAKSAKLDRLKADKVELMAQNASILKKDEVLEKQIRDLHQQLQEQEQEITNLKAWGPDGQPVIPRNLDGTLMRRRSSELTITEEIRRIREAEDAFGVDN